MTLPRAQLVALDATPFYHVMSRCVRQQFLCGFDCHTQRDFSHRREWIRARVRRAANAFAINLHGYAIMSNHFHLVVEIRPDRVNQWSDREVIRRWRTVFRGPEILDRFTRGTTLSAAERIRLKALVRLYRERLGSLSWFMRAINEPIARMANQEDNVAGRFWDGRFKSQALLTAGALVAAMAYVDLNPIRAGLALTPETSDFTSIQERIQQRKRPGQPLRPLAGMPECDDPLACSLDDYLELVDWSGRTIRDGKMGAIPPQLPGLLDRLKLRPGGYARLVQRKEKGFRHWVGPHASLQRIANTLGQRFLHGRRAAAAVFHGAP